MAVVLTLVQTKQIGIYIYINIPMYTGHIFCCNYNNIVRDSIFSQQYRYDVALCENENISHRFVVPSSPELNCFLGQQEQTTQRIISQNFNLLKGCLLLCKQVIFSCCGSLLCDYIACVDYSDLLHGRVAHCLTIRYTTCYYEHFYLRHIPNDRPKVFLQVTLFLMPLTDVPF